MGHKHIYECLDRSLRDVRGEPQKVFGGLTVLFCGDWKQILPVVPRGSAGQIVSATLKYSYIWTHVIPLALTINMRVQNATTSEETFFNEYLEALGRGLLPIEENLGQYRIKVPSKMVLESDKLSDLCSFVFGGMQDNYKTGKWICNRAIITSTNRWVDDVNEHVLKKMLPGEPRQYRSCDILHENEHEYPLELINLLNPSGIFILLFLTSKIVFLKEKTHHL
jgi:hypothetical protein